MVPTGFYQRGELEMSLQKNKERIGNNCKRYIVIHTSLEEQYIILIFKLALIFWQNISEIII